ncbi:MAG: hypothetical protein QME77_12975 [bacterium]|nr:hypothetical protein [bacterium]
MGEGRTVEFVMERETKNTIKYWPMARGLFVLMFVLCTVLAARAQVGGAPSQSTLIIPGIQLGPIRIGMRPSEVLRILGQPTETHTASPVGWNMGWERYPLWVVFWGPYPGGEVKRIITRSSRFATNQGVRVGSRAEEALRKLGPPLDRAEVSSGGALYYRGLVLEYAPGGRINAIAVDAP